MENFDVTTREGALAAYNHLPPMRNRCRTTARKVRDMVDGAELTGTNGETLHEFASQHEGQIVGEDRRGVIYGFPDSSELYVGKRPYQGYPI
jgi:hypothetical protein